MAEIVTLGPGLNGLAAGMLPAGGAGEVWQHWERRGVTQRQKFSNLRQRAHSPGHDALTEEAMTRPAAFAAGSWRYERIEAAGRWLQLDAPDRVSRLLPDFPGSVPADAAASAVPQAG